MSKHQTQLGRVRWVSRRGEGEPNPPRETLNSGANGQILEDTSFVVFVCSSFLFVRFCLLIGAL